MAWREASGQLRAFRAAGAAVPPTRGAVPVAPRPGPRLSWAKGWFVGGYLVGAAFTFVRQGLGEAILQGFTWALWAVVLVGTLRVGHWWLIGRKRGAPWDDVGFGAQFACGVFLTGIMAWLLGDVMGVLPWHGSILLGVVLLGGVATPVVLGVCAGLYMGWDQAQREYRSDMPSPQAIAKAQAQVLPFGLWLGRSTGTLTALGHGAGIAPGQHVVVGLADAAQNVAVFGGIGAGKTTRAIQPLLVQLLEQDAGGLIFDIKGDAHQAVTTLAAHLGREVTLIGPGHPGINLLAGLTPEVAASFLKSVFLLSGGRHDTFWVDTAAELCRNALGVLTAVPEHYTLAGLYTYLFDPQAREATDQAVATRLATLEPPQAQPLRAYQQYHARVFHHFDEKTRAGVQATVAQVLAPFQHPELVAALCATEAEQTPLTALLDGAVFLVDLPLAVWGLGGKVASILIKLRFFNLMQRRSREPGWNQDRPVFFLCDEFQEIISANKDGLSDLNFWDKARSANTIGIIAVQSVSSLYAALGDRDLADAILQNFRQVLCFRTEDGPTLERVQRLLGHIDAAHASYGFSSGTSTGGASLLSSTTETTSETLTSRQLPVLDPQVIRGQ